MNDSLDELLKRAGRVARGRDEAANLAVEPARPGFVERVLSRRQPSDRSAEVERYLRYSAAACVVLAVFASWMSPAHQPSPTPADVALPWFDMGINNDPTWGGL